MKAKQMALLLVAALALAGCGTRVLMRTPVAEPQRAEATGWLEALSAAAPVESGPIIQSLGAATPEVLPGQPVALQALVVHPDGQPIALRWRAQGGVLTADAGQAVAWIPPQSSGTYAITVVASDPKGREAVGTMRLVVP